MIPTLVTLLSAAAVLVMIGVLMLCSGTVTEPDPARFHSHLVWLGGGVVAAAIVASLDYRRWGRGWWPTVLLALVVGSLLAVLVPGVGAWVNGARRWYVIGGQPSEFAKVAGVVILASALARHHERLAYSWRPFARLMAGVTLVAGLVFLEPDWGTSILIATVGMAMLFVAGASAWHLMAVSVTGMVVLGWLVRDDPMRWARVTSFSDPEKFQRGVGWQGWHGLLALGSGGIWGRTLGEGSHKNGFVPEQLTDFIFSLIGEELGLVGTTIVVVLYAAILVCGWSLAWKIADPFGRWIVFGCTLTISLQAFINIGVVTSSLPNKGIPLPFVSYGGSDLVCMLACLGLITAVVRRAPRCVMHEVACPSASSVAAANVPVVAPVPSVSPESAPCRATPTSSSCRSSRFTQAPVFARFRHAFRRMRPSPFQNAPIRHPYQRPPRGSIASTNFTIARTS